MNETSDFVIFLGRFHPLVVHLPIGFIILAAIMEGLSYFKKRQFDGLDKAIAITIFSGAIGAVLSVAIGFMLSKQGGYNDQTLFWHQWLGIVVGVLSFVGWTVKTERLKLGFLSSKVILIVLIILISITGHLGGNLTHGSDYLTAYAPGFIKKAFGNSTSEVALEIPSKPDSIQVYKHLIQPVLNAKCVSCHGESKSSGNLLLNTQEGILEGGDDGHAITAGKPLESGLFKRATLPQSSKKFMPPKGDPLTYSELKLIEWWIKEGASFEDAITAYDIPEDVKQLLLRDFDIDTKPKPYFDTIEVPQLSEETLLELEQAGWMVSFLSDGHRMMDAGFRAGDLSTDTFETLLKAKEQITWLDLSGNPVEDTMLKTVGQLTNLTRLNLSNSEITDAGIPNLKALVHLEVLNLYGTDISDESLKTIESLSGLKRLYLWQTQVTTEGVKALKEQLPDVEVIGIPENSASDI
ncbi:c-type cytochrome domain-containing protein [Seonamhaeicola sp.]|uniref:c-type cytochrome domain-containing protein n=1 Tax=Seonamhaeicola sp. TaxID=1912245 RepID=UPI00260DD9B5|nr:c-type cytochrome domain-containing protein [Seonamhaeicola sp.]